MMNLYFNIENVIRITALLISLSLFMTGLEFVIISFNKNFIKIWSIDNLLNELQSVFPLNEIWIRKLFSLQSFRLVSILQVLIGLYSLLIPNFYSYIFLILCHLYICIRFRGSFNGGSDMMLFVLLTGVSWIYLPLLNDQYQKWGLIYISVHVVFSYLKAGFVKVLENDWRSGKALIIFLSRSHFSQAQNTSLFLLKHNYISMILCWLVLIFELGILLIFKSNNVLISYLVMSFVFHTINYLAFGLNRFLLTWMAGWPSVCFLVLSLKLQF